MVEAADPTMPCRSFPAIARPNARVLILGSMPGQRSLQARQYYAHPQNAFWRITAELLGFEADAPYPIRTAALTDHGVALWDVLKSCIREGSLDAGIRPDSIVPNNFVRFFATHPAIERVCFNGAKAAELFRRHVQSHLSPSLQLQLVQLPSTSPANARLPYADKLQAWQAIRPDGSVPSA